MSTLPTLTGNSLRYRDWVVVNLFLASVFVFLLTPPAAGVAWYLARKSRLTRSQLALMAASLLWSLLVARRLAAAGWFSATHWLLALPAAPLGSGVLRGLYLVSDFLKPRTLQEQLDALEARAERQRLATNRQAQRRGETAATAGWIRLGVRQRGDRLPPFLGMTYRDGWLLMNEQLLDQHLFLLGAPGAGKSETIKRLVREVLQSSDRHVYLVDGKGDEALAADIRGLAHRYERGAAPVFRLGFDTPGAVYDGFRGGPQDVYNRLLALIRVQEVDGNAQYYADINRDLLQLACFAGDGPPRSFEELRRRLNRAWLLDAYKDDPFETRTLQDEIDRKDIQNLARRIRPLVREFSPCVGPEGFALEEVACAIFSMRVQSVGDTARRFLDFLVEDLKDFVGKRQRHPAVLVIDEFGQFANDNIISLLTLARSSQLGVVLATQNMASLKDVKTKQNVLANSRTKILMATDFPEEVAELAGTAYQVESSMQHDEGEITGLGSARVQHGFKIDMNEAAKLQPGEALVIRQRYAVKIKVHAIGGVAHIAPQVGEERTRVVEVEETKRREPVRLEPVTKTLEQGPPANHAPLY